MGKVYSYIFRKGRRKWSDLIAIPRTIIYDLYENPVDVKRWTELENMRIYYEFLIEHENEF